MPLSTRQRKHLRGLSHQLHPVVTVADRGLTENVMREIELALDHHELIKVRLRSDRATRLALGERIALECGAEKVHAIGQVICFFRRNPKKPVVELPA